jgi:hypothetical protein
MTTAQSNPVRQARARLDYTPDRHAALILVSRNKISSVDAVLRRRDGAGLDLGVFASLLALRNASCVETHEPPAASPAGGQHWPVRLSVLGVRLLAQFNLEHAHVPQVESSQR